MEESQDSVWTSTESAKHIHRLGQVEQEIVRLMELASECMSLLALPQTDPIPQDDDAKEGKDGTGTGTIPKEVPLPRGPNRSAAFASNAEQYFETLNSIQTGIRTSIARVRASRIPPGALRAPEGRLVAPRTLGTSIPSADGAKKASGLKREDTEMADLDSKDKDKTGITPGSSDMGLQERKVETDAWAGIAAGLQEVEKALARTSSAS